MNLVKTLADYANESRQAADQERGKKDFFQPTSGKEAHIRILEWFGHVPCWVEGHVHYLPTGDGVKVLTCGDENCYTCGRLSEIAVSKAPNDVKFVNDAVRKMKIMLYMIDWDNRSKGPQLWEPKNTQNCATWTSLLALFTNMDEYGEKVYRMDMGLMINLMIVKEMRKMRNGQQEMAIQKSFFPGQKMIPIQYRKDGAGQPFVDADGSFSIRYLLPDGKPMTFKLPDLGNAMPEYDEEYHRQCWGDESGGGGYDAGQEGFTDAGAGGGEGDWGAGAEQPAGEGGEAAPFDTGEAGAGEGSDWGEAAGGEGDNGGWGDQPEQPANPEPPPSRPPSRPPMRPPQATNRPAGSGSSRPPARPATPTNKPSGGRTAPPPRRPSRPAPPAKGKAGAKRK